MAVKKVVRKVGKPSRKEKYRRKEAVVRRRSKMLADVSGLTLPDAPKEADTDFGNYLTLIYGRPGMGKSTFASTYPDACFFSCERISKALEVFDLNEAKGGVTDWGVFRKGVELLEDNPDKFRTVVVDTIDAAYQQCLEWVCKKKKIEHPQDDGYGKGWNAVWTEFNGMLDRIIATGRGLVLTSHSKEIEITAHSGDTYTRIQPSMSGQAYKAVKAKSDFVLYAEFIKDNSGKSRRVLITEGDEVVDAKSPELDTPIPMYLPFPKKGGFDLVNCAFLGEDVGIPMETVKPAKATSKAGTDFIKKGQARAAAKKVARRNVKKGGPKKVRRA